MNNDKLSEMEVCIKAIKSAYDRLYAAQLLSGDYKDNEENQALSNMSILIDNLESLIGDYHE